MVESTLNRVSLRDVIVDFFGSLIPGIVFTGMALATFAWPLFSLISSLVDLQASQTTPSIIAQKVVTLINPIRLEVFAFLIMLSYVVGHLFYRQDPKKPDQKSFEYIKRQYEKSGQPDHLKHWVAQEVKDCEFPYSNLHGYLKQRGLDHLAAMVDWQPDLDSTHPGVRRTKNFMNILKIRLAFHHADRCSAIARNEAHVRLMSSTWYMARLLRVLSLLALAIALLALGIMWWTMPIAQPALIIRYILPTILPVMILVIVLWILHTIQKFLHYQRVREAIFVLETAYTAFHDNPERIRDICPNYLLHQSQPTLVPVTSLSSASNGAAAATA